MRTAVIIPTLNDEAALPRLLARLARLAPPADEVIVVDGAASEPCELVCRSAGAVWIAAHAGRGGQLALGAARALSDVLWFLRPDCEPPVEAIAAIRASVARGAVGGHFRFRWAGPPSAFKRLLERCIAWRSRWGMVYGDQGIFVTRAAYDATPGFALQPLFEEVAMVRALQRTGRFVGLALPLAVSPGPWERDGYLKRVLTDRLLALGFSLGISTARLARWRGTLPARAVSHPAGTGRHSASDGHEAHKV
jgi:glycosyltransferase involved in cell wall biosynthesis